MKIIIYIIFGASLIFKPLLIISQNEDYLYQNSIFVENKKDLDNKNRYTEDNEIFTLGSKFYYTYKYIDSLSNEYSFNYSEIDNSWEFVPINNITDSTVIGLNLEVLYGLGPFEEINPNYSQTVIKYSYVCPKGSIFFFNEQTGVIENPKNVWMHPPRTHLFKILELNPFPFIQSPYKSENQWQWELEIGDMWGDPLWAVWEGSIRNRCIYEITDTNYMLKTSLGNFNCFIIESACKNEIGETFLKSYFNPVLGFVKLEYINIDKSRITIELEKVEK